MKSFTSTLAVIAVATASLGLEPALAEPVRPGQVAPTGGTAETGETTGRIGQIHPGASVVEIGGVEFAWASTARATGLGPTPVGLDRLKPGLLVRASYLAPLSASQRPEIVSLRVLTE